NDTAHFTGSQRGDTGHYVATLNFPKAGQWVWTIEAFSEQPMPPLSVVPGAETKTESPTPATSRLPGLLAGVLGLGSTIAGVFILKSKNATGLALIIIGLSVAGVGIASATGQAVVKPAAYVSALSSED